MRNILAKITLILLILIISSCNAVKRVHEDNLLLTKNTITVDGKKINSEEVKSLIHQRPNSTLLGFPLRLNIYNSAKENSDSILNNRLEKKLLENGFWQKTLSKKQFIEWYNYKKGWHNWRKKTGEAPTIINPLLSQKTLNRLQTYYGSKGYFNNTATFKIDTLKRKKRGDLSYDVKLGAPYFIDSLATQISSKDIEKLYEQSKPLSLIKKGDQFNLFLFEKERARIATYFKNNGVYNFQESAIVFDISRDTVLTNNDQKTTARLEIGDLIERNENQTIISPYTIYKNEKINIYADYIVGASPDSLQSINYNNYTIFYKDKLKYSPKALTNAIFMKKDSVYNDLERIRTYKQISNLRTFKYPNITFIQDSSKTKLTTNIYLSARPRFSFEHNFDISHSNIQDYGISYRTSLISRNAFGGAETLEISARGTLGASSKDAAAGDNTFFNISEIGGDINIYFPRILFPFNTNRIIPKHMFPQTVISAGTSIQKNIGLDKQTFNADIKYNWDSSSLVKNVLELLNIQFVKNLNPNNFYNVYESTYNQLNGIANNELYTINPDYFDTNNLTIPSGTTNFINDVLNTSGGPIPSTSDDYRSVLSIFEREKRLTVNELIFGSSFTYTRNNRKNINDEDFSQLRIKLESAGNLLSLLSNVTDLSKNDSGNKMIFDVPFAQYIKTEVDYIKHWTIGRSDVVAFRSFAGIAIPYGNSDFVPFSRSYFGGGSNDNRAWNAYSLGPGRSQFQLDFNEANFKLAFNLEYRFNIFGNFNGALFADAGNIWYAFDNETDPDKKFNGIESLKDIAIGSGFGIRYDFNYFIIRLDLGFKTYNPQLDESKRWFYDYNFKNVVYQFGINYPF